jgi:Kyakuja-Dileera-Zisupton transposase
VTINQALDVFDDGLEIGYDIGCSFSATIAKSSIAQKAHNKNLCLVVPAFYGCAHRRLCQLFFHPLYVTGFGIEDLETAERIFASFNGLANTTHHASRFHCLQAIDLYARQHGDDKYQELCM